MQPLKEAIEEYRGASAAASAAGPILRSLVKRHSAEILFDSPRLQREMMQAGAKETDTLKICLLTKVTGFHELVQAGRGTQQADLDRFIRNAVLETGFHQTELMKLTAELAGAAGFAVRCRTKKNLERAIPERAYVIPASLYEEDLNAFQQAVERASSGESGISGSEFNKIEALAAAGMPRAKYYLGYCLLYGVPPEMDCEGAREKGAALLREAAEAGDFQAAAKLGDYYFSLGPQAWGKAYSCYTGYGAMALDRERQRAVVQMQNQKRFNRRLMGWSAALLLLMAAAVAAAPGAALYPACYALGSFCVLAGLAVLVGAGLCHIARPYGSVYFIPVAMFILWSIHAAARLLA